MAGSTSDKISRATDSSSARPVIATLTGSGKAIGAGSVTISAATNWTTTTKLYIAIYTVTSAGIKDPTTQTDWTATLSGTTLSNLTLTGGTDRAYTAGAYCEITVTAAQLKDTYDAWIAQHNQNGTHGAITATSLSTTAGVTAGSGLTVSAGTITAPTSSLTGLGAAWSTFSSTVTAGSGTFTTVSGTVRYIQIGKTVHWKADITVTTAGTASGAVLFTLPVTAQSGAGNIGVGREDAISGKMISAKLNSASQASSSNYDNTSWIASGSIGRLSGTYEAA